MTSCQTMGAEINYQKKRPANGGPRSKLNYLTIVNLDGFLLTVISAAC
jgi:hypothetical protein